MGRVLEHEPSLERRCALVQHCQQSVDCSLLNYDGRDDHDEDSLSRLGAL